MRSWMKYPLTAVLSLLLLLGLMALAMGIDPVAISLFFTVVGGGGLYLIWRRKRPVAEAKTKIRATAMAEGEMEGDGDSYQLQWFEGDTGQGYFVVRVEDDQNLAWRNLDPGDGLLAFNVAGVSHRPEVMQDGAFAPGRPVALVPEPENPHDKRAMAVYDGTRTKHVGYVPKESLDDGHDILADPTPWRSLIMWESRGRSERTGIRVLLVSSETEIEGISCAGQLQGGEVVHRARSSQAWPPLSLRLLGRHLSAMNQSRAAGAVWRWRTGAMRCILSTGGRVHGEQVKCGFCTKANHDDGNGTD